MVKRTGPSGELCIFRSRPLQKPSTLEGFLCLHLAPSPPQATLEEVL